MTEKKSAKQSANIAVVFPGQGAQKVGMLAAYDGCPEVAAAVQEASDALGEDLAQLIATDEKALAQTVNTQPVMLALGVGVYRAAAPHLPPPACFAGHSLGEYSALVCAGALTLADGARLVRRRAKLMQAVKTSATMTVILGALEDTVDQHCALLREQRYGIWPVNINAKTQIVIAGEEGAMSKAVDFFREHGGARRVIPLPMSVPSHCPLMEDAAAAFKKDLAAAPWQPQPLRAPVVHAAPWALAKEGFKDTPPPMDMIDALAAQLVMPIRWQDILRQCAQYGAQAVYEAGASVLTGLGKESGLPHIALNSAAAVQQLAAASSRA